MQAELSTELVGPRADGNDTEGLVAKAEAFTVTNNEGYLQVCEFEKGLRDLDKHIVEHHATRKRMADQLHKRLVAEEREDRQPITLALGVIRPKRIAYEETQERIRKEEERKQRELQAKADEEAMAGLPFKLHDFGARGVSSFESAGLGGAAHLVNFMGSDTITGALFAMKYYNTEDMVAFSVPAAEHSSITSWGKDRETEAYKNMLKQFGGKFPIISVVSDSYDIYNAVENMWGGELKDTVVKSGSMLVVRPDSGNPAEVVSKIAMLLDSTFGSTVNGKGYKVLNNVRIIQGDGINEESIEEILATLRGYGFSSDNVVFGQGGALLQQVNRDTQKFAMKASAALVDGEWIEVFKDPITDSGKRSKKGKISLYSDGESLFTRQLTDNPEYVDMMETVFENGKIVKEYTFAEVRELTEATT